MKTDNTPNTTDTFTRASAELADEMGITHSTGERERRRITQEARSKRKRKRKQTKESRRQNRPRK